MGLLVLDFLSLEKKYRYLQLEAQFYSGSFNVNTINDCYHCMKIITRYYERGKIRGRIRGEPW